VDLQGRLQQDVNRVKGLQEEERVHSAKIRNGPSHGGKSAKGSGEKGQELKVSWHGYNQGKNKDINLKFQVVLLKA